MPVSLNSGASARRRDATGWLRCAHVYVVWFAAVFFSVFSFWFFLVLFIYFFSFLFLFFLLSLFFLVFYICTFFNFQMYGDFS